MKLNEESQEKQSQIEVRVFANLRDILNWKTQNMIIPAGTSIRDFIQRLVADISDENIKAIFLSEILDSDKHHIKRFVKIVLNGQILHGDHALETLIPPGPSVIAIFPPLGGG